jgi:hypothetical protein
VKTFIERVPCDSHIGGRTDPVYLDLWKAMMAEGWELTVLIAPDQKTLVALGWR